MKKLIVVLVGLSVMLSGAAQIFAQQRALPPGIGPGEPWTGLGKEPDIYPEITEGEGVSWYRHDGTPIDRSRVAQAVKESIQNVVSAALIEVCSSTIRPTEMLLTLSAGVDFYAEFSGGISLKFNVKEACLIMEQLMVKARNEE